MDLEKILLHILVVLVASRIAAEVAERIRQPAVLIEIVAGILIGPSLLGLVGGEEILHIVGEIGAILLLFEVGMQMNLTELGRVGGDSLKVAALGIIVPMALGYAVCRALGVPETTALFLAGGITATSVGITARVFGDLRALATAEARTVLGAAVADDVGGLLVLTFVGAVASGAGVSIGGMASVIGVALGFVVAATVAAIWIAPVLFGAISARSRTDGTLMVSALVFALLIAQLASVAHLAPIIGAFIAGLALSRTAVRDDVQRRMVPLAHFFVPIFFLQIGIDTRLSVFAEPALLGITVALTVVAIVTKVVAGIGVKQGKADRLLVGISMIPRGEVGLIFAGIGLAAGMGARYYAVLVAVVLITTLVTPPLIRRRIQHSRKRTLSSRSAAVEPPGGWLQIDDEQVELTAEPPDLLAPRIGFETAIACASRRPGEWLMQWLASAQSGAADWDEPLRRLFFKLLREGNERSWRFLEVTGLLGYLAPTLQQAINEKKADPFSLDPSGTLRWDVLEELRAVLLAGSYSSGEGAHEVQAVWKRIERKSLVLFAALCRSAFGGGPEAGLRAKQLATTIGLHDREASTVGFLVEERSLLPAAARRLDMASEESVLELAAHIESSEGADALYLLAVAENAMEPWEQERLEELFNLVQDTLAHPDVGGEPGGILDLRRGEITRALSHLPAKEVERHLRAAPRRYLMAQKPGVIARHLKMTETPFGRNEVRMEAEQGGEKGEWIVHVATKDRRGLLASIAGVMFEEKLDVHEAFISTWRDGGAIDVFRLRAPAGVDWQAVAVKVETSLSHGSNGGISPGIEGTVDIDNQASPWHTIVEIRAYDREGLLYRVASALARAGLQIHMAIVSTSEDVAVDIFYVTGRNGGKLDETGERELRLALAGKPLRRWRSSLRLPQDANQS